VNPVIECEILTEAEGNIEATDTQRERVDELTERLMSGELHVGTEHTVVCGCIDGRSPATPKPNSAGGSESLMVADDLTNKQFAGNDGTTLAAYRNVVGFLKKIGQPVGGHDDDHASGDKSGCGANDKLEQIYDMIVRKGEHIRDLAAQYGIVIDDETHELIVSNAAQRAAFSPGAELKAELDWVTEGTYDRLQGSHNEVIVALNTVAGTTLDRDALREAFGDEYQAFNVDVWAFQASANLISTTDDSREAQQKVAALAYYNFATALTLCGARHACYRTVASI